MLPFALSIFTGAFLLFQVQPLIGKFILPWFGGSPGVWTTCLLFFQTLLLGGYAYAHFSSTYLKPRNQAVLHLALLLLSLVFLPITPADSWKTQIAGEPTWHILLLLVATIGLPYFVLSATGPLMQQWFGTTHPGASPYRLYALSNIGSLLALLSYPIFFEVRFSRDEQAGLWSIGLSAFVLLCGWCAWRVWRHLPAPATARTADEAPEAATPGIHRLFWIALPAIASVLLLATTNKLCQEVAVIPFLWVLPLALYLLSFVLCFDHARWYHRGTFATLLVLSLAAVCLMLEAGTEAPMKLQIAGYNLALFVACMVCHGELYQLKPPPRRLTGYFLFISAGGALGGLLVAIVAPALLQEFHEFEIGLVALAVAFAALCFVRRSQALALGAIIGALAATFAIPGLLASFESGLGFWTEFVLFFQVQKWTVIFGIVGVLCCSFDFSIGRFAKEWRWPLGLPVVLLAGILSHVLFQHATRAETATVLAASRNFYGTLKVYDHSVDEPDQHYRLLMHGATTHGLQFTAPDRAMLPSTYYGPTSGVGLAVKHLDRPAGMKVGIVGLGTGTIAAYGRAGDTYRFYEINPAVERLARAPFTYLAQTPAKVDVIMGDARLELEHELDRQEPQNFDLLALDAFSSDAIPVHLLTAEALALYLRHLKPDGVIAIHISNRYLDLQPVVERLAAHHGLAVACISDDPVDDWWQYSTTWMLLTKNLSFLAQSEIMGVTESPKPAAKTAPLWTDDQANLYSILK